MQYRLTSVVVGAFRRLKGADPINTKGKDQSLSLYAFAAILTLALPLQESLAASCPEAGAGAGYWKHGRHVYYGVQGDVPPDGDVQDNVVEGADSGTFAIIEEPFLNTPSGFCEGPNILNRFGKDKKNVFYQGQKILGADPASFQIISDGFSKDKRAAYYKTDRISFRPKDFRLLSEKNYGYATDGKDFFFRSRKMAGDGFKFLSGDYDYSRNRTHVFHDGVIVAGAGPESFSIFDTRSQSTTTKDKAHVFFEDKVIEGADPESFQMIEAPGLFKDKNFVYVDGKSIPELEGDNVRYSELRHYLITTKFVYKLSYKDRQLQVSKLSDVDPSTFHDVGKF